jgi:hypothetical protein
MKNIKMIFLCALLLSACGRPHSLEEPIGTKAVDQESSPTSDGEKQLDNTVNATYEPSVSGLSADVETYYKTMVFIEGTAQLMAKIDLASITSSDNQAVFLPLMTMPGVMDDRVIAAQQIPVPAGFEAAWEKATEAEAGLTQALQESLMAYSQEDFLQAVSSNGVLASEAVADAEAVLGSQGVSSDDIATANRAALTEMGEAYQAFASFIAAGQAQSDDGSQ